MAIYESAVAGIALATAAVMAGIAVYGMTGSRNLIRQLLSIEVLFNAVLLAVLVLASIPANILSGFTIVLISIVSGEVIVLVAVIAAYYRVAKTLESSPMEEEGV